MFEKLEMLPADPILGLTEAYKQDTNPNKINLGVGVYKDENNQTPILESVKKAEAILLQKEDTKSYLAIPGLPELGDCVRELLFGEGHEIIQSKRAVTAQTPGGTGGLRVAAEFIKRCMPGAKVWLSEPTWPNHHKIFDAAGIETAGYPYYDADNKSLAFDKMTEALSKVPAGDVVLMHACCHNPSGMDPSPDQWAQLAKLRDQQKWLPLFDFAYQGFGDGLEEDAVGVRTFAKPDSEMIVVSSFSKNFGLYNERIGAMTLVGPDIDAAAKAFSHIKQIIRSNYSNPPAHGGGIVATVLTTPELYKIWVDEVAQMRNRINGMRDLFVKTLADKGVKQDFSFITTQRGMFSFSGLNRDQVNILKEKYAIYIVGSGRVNVAGMTPKNMEGLCQAIAEVL
jgi:aspartate aminotransferase/aromatic-amino-acid transaminase